MVTVNGAGETLRTGVPNTVGGVIYTVSYTHLGGVYYINSHNNKVYIKSRRVQ